MSKIVSHSQLHMWSQCPLQWKLVYVDKIGADRDTIHNIFGSAMHDTVQHWLDILFHRSASMARSIDMSDYLKERMIVHFKRSIVEENGVRVFICDKQTLMEFFADGVAILKWLQSHLDKYFSVVEWTLEGVEIPLTIEVRPNIKFRGLIDIVLRHKLTGIVKIIDLKTSTKGWNKWAKADKSKTNQILLYKKYYAQQFNLSEDLISVDYYILRRKLYENVDYPIPRVSKFSPAAARPSMKLADESFQNFLDSCFTEDGEYIADQKATPSKSACRFCPFNKTEHCSEGVWDE